MVVVTNVRVAPSWADPEKAGTPDHKIDTNRVFVSSGFNLQYNEVYKTFGAAFTDVVSAFPQVVVPLPAGNTQILIDLETGLPMPYTAPAGYRLRILSDLWSFGVRGRTEAYVLGQYYGGAEPETLGTHYYNVVGGFDSRAIDPTFVLPIPMQLQVENIDGADLRGFWFATYILSAEATPPFPETKVVKCKFCSHMEEVSHTTTVHKCTDCGVTNIYFSFKRGGS